MSNIDIYKLKDRIKNYQKGREEYLELIEIAKDNLKDYDENAQSVLLEDINQRRKEEFKLFCKSAKYLYKNRKEIIQSGKFGWIVLDFLEFDYAKKVYLKDLLSAWEEGFTWIDDGNECLIIGIKTHVFDNPKFLTGKLTLLTPDKKIKTVDIDKKQEDDLIYSIDTDIISTKLTENISDFNDYTSFSEIPARFLGIKEW